MKAVIQRVKRADVRVDDRLVGEIGAGLLVLLGVIDDDTEEDLDYLVRKITKMRIFEDENEKMNLALGDVGGSLLVVSQFTLLADTRKGNRPSFTSAGSPEYAYNMYKEFVKRCTNAGFDVQEGSFGAHMEVSLINDGPVTIIIDSKNP